MERNKKGQAKSEYQGNKEQIEQIDEEDTETTGGNEEKESGVQKLWT